jgi:hypothetical protein
MTLTRATLLLCTFALTCCSAPQSEGSPDPSAQAASTYSELYASYFAIGTPGHCATAGCHADPGHTVWLCGASKGDCYTGMVAVHLIDPTDPTHSSIADAHRSPLVWFNSSGGNMPFDAQVTNDEARAAIAAWVAAGAKDD